MVRKNFYLTKECMERKCKVLPFRKTRICLQTEMTKTKYSKCNILDKQVNKLSTELRSLRRPNQRKMSMIWYLGASNQEKHDKNDSYEITINGINGFLTIILITMNSQHSYKHFIQIFTCF